MAFPDKEVYKRKNRKRIIKDPPQTQRTNINVGFRCLFKFACRRFLSFRAYVAAIAASSLLHAMKRCRVDSVFHWEISNCFLFTSFSSCAIPSWRSPRNARNTFKPSRRWRTGVGWSSVSLWGACRGVCNACGRQGTTATQCPISAVLPNAVNVIAEQRRDHTS